MSCCVRNCFNGRVNGYRLFAIPKRKNALFRKPWLESAGLKEEDLPKDPRICEAHFPIEAFTQVNNLGWLALKHNAVPTIFGNNLPMTVSLQVRGSEYAPVFQTCNGSWDDKRTLHEPLVAKEIQPADNIRTHGKFLRCTASKESLKKKRKLSKKLISKDPKLDIAFPPWQICCVSNCKFTKQSNSMDARNFFNFPTEQELRNRWILNIRSVNGTGWIPGVTSAVCSAHFIRSSGERPGNDLKLTAEAVPTVFHLPETEYKDVSDNLLEVSFESGSEDNIKPSAFTVVNEHNYSNPEPVQNAVLGSGIEEDSAKRVTGVKDEGSTGKSNENIDFSYKNDEEENKSIETDFKNCLKEISDKIRRGDISETSSKRILEASVQSLRENSHNEDIFKHLRVDDQLLSLKRENRVMKREITKILKLVETLHQSNMELRANLDRVNSKNKELMGYEEFLRKIFNPDQLEAISRKDCNYKGMKWNVDTIKQCTLMRTRFGRFAYKELAKKLPIPSLSTLNRYKAKLEISQSSAISDKKSKFK